MCWDITLFIIGSSKLTFEIENLGDSEGAKKRPKHDALDRCV